MRQVFFAVVLLLSAAVPSLAQEQLKVGNTYSGNIKLSSPNSGIYLALPDGLWTLTSFERTTSRPEVHGTVQMLQGVFASTDDQKRVTSVVWFSVGNADTGVWEKPQYCFRTDTFFLHAETQRRNRELRCWGVHPNSLATPSANASKSVREFYQYVSRNGLKLPQAAIAVTFYRASGPKYLNATYFRNPEIEGFPRTSTAPWQKDVVVGDSKRLKYLERAKAWGEQWQPTFEAAFSGRPK